MRLIVLIGANNIEVFLRLGLSIGLQEIQALYDHFLESGRPGSAKSIDMALNVLRMVLSQGMKLAGAGLLLGVLAAIGLSRFMASMLFGVGAMDLVTFIAVPVLLLVVAMLACLIPARRATRIDPLEALRAE